jgi:hypothetical protein
VFECGAKGLADLELGGDARERVPEVLPRHGLLLLLLLVWMVVVDWWVVVSIYGWPPLGCGASNMGHLLETSVHAAALTERASGHGREGVV